MRERANGASSDQGLWAGTARPSPSHGIIFLGGPSRATAGRSIRGLPTLLTWGEPLKVLPEPVPETRAHPHFAFHSSVANMARRAANEEHENERAECESRFNLPKEQELAPNLTSPESRGDLEALSRLAIEQFSAAFGERHTAPMLQHRRIYTF